MLAESISLWCPPLGTLNPSKLVVLTSQVTGDVGKMLAICVHLMPEQLPVVGSGLPPQAGADSLLVVARRLCVPLSVLDLCPVPTGESIGEALRRSVDLARHAERLGFTRYWVAEHHSLPGIASSAPAVLVGQIASATSAIRVGSGGVMLPNHPPLTVAEQFGTLEALHPGRIDLGIGARARHRPGNGAGTAAQRGRAADGGLRPPARGTASLLRRPRRGRPTPTPTNQGSGPSRPRATIPPYGCSGPPATAPSWRACSACRSPSPIT